MSESKIQNYTEELIELRRYFHQHPELALQETETSAYIQKYLKKLGYEINHVEPTGVIAELPGLSDREKMAVLRAEIYRVSGRYLWRRISVASPEISVG